MYVLGIDGGGTKTKGVIASSSGNIIAEATVGASNPNSVSKDDLELELAKLFKSLRTQNGQIFNNVKRVFAGMSGVALPSARQEMEHTIRRILSEDIPVTVDNDAVTALYSGTLGKPGIVQIGGTGSITFGLNNEGILERLGGWGYLLGEKGSGYAIGSEGLEVAFQAHDGLGDKTKLTKLFLDHFEVQKLPDIIQPIYQSKNPKEVISSLCKIVVKAADLGDNIAQQVIKGNAQYIGEAITCLIAKLFPKASQEIPVVLTGGLFNRLDVFQGTMEEHFQKSGLKVRLIKPEMEPVGGAVVAALLEENVEVNKNFRLHFNT